MQTKKNKSAFKILVMRFSAMGDVVMTVPVVRELRQKYPEAKIVILTNPFFKFFFRDIKGIEFFDPDFKVRHKGFWGLKRLSADLVSKYGKFDMVADLHDSLRSKIIRFFLGLKGAEVAVIDKGRAAKRRLTRFKNKVMVQLEPTVERYVDVFEKLGLAVPMPQPCVVGLADRDVVPLSDKCVRATGGHDGVWIGLAPFAQHEGKIYPVELMEQVIRKLSAQEGFKILLFGGGAPEKDFADKMAVKYPNVISVIGKLRLDAELDIISNLDLMVSMDSAAMHMASLLGVPVISIWGATHPFAGFYGFGQDYNNAIQLDIPCRPCSVYGNKPCKLGDYRCMKDITPDMIVEKVKAALAGPR